MFGDSGAYFKLLQEDQTFVFYVANEGKAGLKTAFQLELENLSIEGEPEGANEFALEIFPGNIGTKILRPISSEEGTGLQMQFQCSVIHRASIAQ